MAFVVPATPAPATPAPVTLVKSGQVGRAVLENLVQNSTGAQALLEAAKRVSECKPDVGGPLPEDATPLKTMKQTFMDESQKPAVIEAFIPLRRPQGASQVRRRESRDIRYSVLYAITMFFFV